MKAEYPELLSMLALDELKVYFIHDNQIYHLWIVIPRG